MKERKEQIEEAVKVLRAGGILLYPTDTIWGIGCDATDEKAVERVFEIKQRADSKSLIILASDMDMVARYVREIPEMAVTVESLSDKPLTIIYPEGINLAPNVTAEDGSIAIRIPKSAWNLSAVSGSPSSPLRPMSQAPRPPAATSTSPTQSRHLSICALTPPSTRAPRARPHPSSSSDCTTRSR